MRRAASVVLGALATVSLIGWAPATAAQQDFAMGAFSGAFAPGSMFAYHGSFLGHGSPDRAHGHLYFSFTSGGTRKGRVDCVNVRGNEAVLTGTVTQARNTPDDPPLGFFELVLRDNGRPNGPLKDQFTASFASFALNCRSPFETARTTIERGNIVVKDNTP